MLIDHMNSVQQHPLLLARRYMLTNVHSPLSFRQLLQFGVNIIVYL